MPKLVYTSYYQLYNAESFIHHHKSCKAAATYSTVFTILKTRNTQTDIRSVNFIPHSLSTYEEVTQNVEVEASGGGLKISCQDVNFRNIQDMIELYGVSYRFRRASYNNA